MPHTDPLEVWVKDGVSRSKSRGYDPSEFVGMCARYGTVPAMERLMKSGQIQSGLVRLNALGMAEEWSVEAGILRFPDRFSKAARNAAQFRLSHIDDEGLR